MKLKNKMKGLVFLFLLSIILICFLSKEFNQYSLISIFIWVIMFVYNETFLALGCFKEENNDGLTDNERFERFGYF